jgi:hypothetical protein
MPRQGEDFHKLVHHLESVLANRPDVTIEPSKMLRDKRTGHLREHDVVLTYKEGHRKLVVAIECRDRSRKVTVEQVEAFQNKCEDTGIDRGVIVSSKGFYETTLTKAASYGIDCLMLQQIDQLEWFAVDAFVSYERRLSNWNIRVVPVDPELAVPARLFYRNPDGELAEITKGRLNHFAVWLFDHFSPLEIKEPKGTFHLTYNPDDYFLVDRDGEQKAVSDIVFTGEYETIERLIPFRLFEYRAGEGAEIATAAYSDIAQLSNFQGRLMITRKEDGIYLRVVGHGNSPTEINDDGEPLFSA